MNYLNWILRGLTVVPGVIQSVETMFGSGSGAQKKQTAIAMVGTAINITDAISTKSVIDGEAFQKGLGNVIDGVVACFNASMWAKK